MYIYRFIVKCIKIKAYFIFNLMATTVYSVLHNIDVCMRGHM